VIQEVDESHSKDTFKIGVQKVQEAPI